MRSAALSHCPVHTFGVGGWVEIRIWQLLKIHAAHSKSCFALKLVQFVKSAVFGVGSNSKFCQTKRSKFSFEHIKESNLWYTNILQNQTLLRKVKWISIESSKSMQARRICTSKPKQAKLHYHTQLTPVSCQVTGPITCQIIDNLDIPLPDFCLSCVHVSKFMPALLQVGQYIVDSYRFIYQLRVQPNLQVETDCLALRPLPRCLFLLQMIQNKGHLRELLGQAWKPLAWITKALPTPFGLQLLSRRTWENAAQLCTILMMHGLQINDVTWYTVVIGSMCILAGSCFLPWISMSQTNIVKYEKSTTCNHRLANVLFDFPDFGAAWPSELFKRHAATHWHIVHAKKWCSYSPMLCCWTMCQRSKGSTIIVANTLRPYNLWGHIINKSMRHTVILRATSPLIHLTRTAVPFPLNWDLLCLIAKNAHCISLHSIGIPSNPLLEETRAIAMWPNTSCLRHHMAVAKNVFLTPPLAPLAPCFCHCPEKCRVRCGRRGKLMCFYFVRIYIYIFYILYKQYIMSRIFVNPGL